MQPLTVTSRSVRAPLLAIPPPVPALPPWTVRPEMVAVGPALTTTTPKLGAPNLGRRNQCIGVSTGSSVSSGTGTGPDW